jgi:2-C-methyl-D-erythritol 4-phosphate cytidylyltransferase
VPEELIAIIVAAGKSQRMGGADKQLRTIGGVPVLARTVAAFQSCEDVGAIVLVLNPDNMGAAAEMSGEYGWSKVRSMVAGGERRQDSVRAGLGALPPCDLVVVHDAARPLITTDLIRRGVEVATATGAAAIAAMPVKDTIKRVDDGGRVVETPPRERLWAAQTPQVAHRAALERAFALADRRGLTVTDEAALLEAAGEPVSVFAGSYHNLKITTPEDLAIAAALLVAGS